MYLAGTWLILGLVAGVSHQLAALPAGKAKLSDQITSLMRPMAYSAAVCVAALQVFSTLIWGMLPLSSWHTR